jgi:glycosyltransferase involved in cell wall biosynthesis
MTPPMKMPLVSVILPVFNAEEFIQDSLQSLLRQTYEHLELMVIDDGSEDRSFEIITAFAKQDSRVRVFKHASNIGLVATLNEGFDLATGDLIARMDADDICYPRRLELQVAEFTRNPDLCLCGTNVDYLFFRNRIMEMPHRPYSSNEIRIINIFEVFFVHPTVMFNRAMMNAAGLRYDPGFPHAEDYDLFGRISFSHPVAQIDVKGVVVRRQAHDSVASRHRAEQVKSHFRVMAAQLQRFGIMESAEIFVRIADLDQCISSFDWADLSETIKNIWMHDGFRDSDRVAFEAGFNVLLAMLIEASQLRGDLRAGISAIRAAGLERYIHPRDRLAGLLAHVMGSTKACALVGRLKRFSQLARSRRYDARLYRSESS